MAYRLAKEKARAIATEYYTNGFKKVEALLSVGYSDTYANNAGLKLFDNERVIEAMNRLSTVAVIQTGYTLEQCQSEYEQVKQLAIKEKQYSTAATCITGKARLHGFDKDNDVGKAEAPTYTPEELAAAAKIAAELTKPVLKAKTGA